MLHRVLLWRRSDNICFALLLEDEGSVTVGEKVACAIRGILQVLSALCGCSGQLGERRLHRSVVPGYPNMHVVRGAARLHVIPHAGC